MQDLTGKTAVVTGAAGGIGLGLARRFVAEGMAVVIADIDEADLKSAAVALEADGADVLAVATDVGDRASVDALADAAYERFGSVHVVCANAGVAGPAADLIWDVPPGEFARVYGVNVFGLTNTIGAFVPRLIAGGEAGHVVLTTSLASFLLYPAAAPYFSSKHAALAVADILRAQLAAVAPRIGASVLCPDRVRTRILERQMAHDRALGKVPAYEDVLQTDDPEIATPADAADAVLDAIRSGRYHVFTHPDSVSKAAMALTAAIGNLDA